MLSNTTLELINKNRALGSSNQCYDIMYAITRANQVNNVLEIGTHQGASSITFCQAILNNNQIPKIYTVDSWIQSDMKLVAETNIKNAGFENYITMIRGDSKNEIPKILKTFLPDLIFIDGDHDPEAVLIDYKNCRDFTKMILFHDTGLNCNIPTQVKQDGWQIINFPTRYVEGDNHPVGIALAYDRKIYV
jgi:cephalosporin hydroxylase